jgi:hypothetical protein
MAEFKWDGDDSNAVILPRQPRTAVYSGRQGNVVIRQERDECEEYDPQIMLSPQGALAIAWALIEEAHLIGLPEPSGSLMVESPNWPPITKRTDKPAKLGPRHKPNDGEPELLAAMNRAAE